MRIQSKLIVASLLASFMLVGSMLLLVRWSIDRGMLSYVNDRQAAAMHQVAINLAAHYQEYKGWQRLQASPFFFHQIIRQQAGDFAIALGPPIPPPPAHMLDRHDSQSSESRRVRPRPPAHLQRDESRRPHPSELPDRSVEPHNSQGEQRSQQLSNGAHDGGGHSDDKAFKRLGDPRPGRPPRSFFPFSDSFVLSDVNKQVLVGNFDPVSEYLQQAIESEEQVVGYLHYKKMDQITDGFELTFIEQQRQAFLLIGGLVLFFSICLSLPLARHLVDPVKQLAKQTRALTQGDYELKSALERGDEIGSLSDDIDRLRRTLLENETMRRRWVADTSHELRTPVALLQAQIEAMQDGVRPIDKNNIDAMHKEILRLSTLISDLQQLSASDIGSLQYQMQSVNLSELLSDLISRHAQSFLHKSLRLHSDIDEGAFVRGDVTRLQQLFDNLLNNSLKYTDSGGIVRIVLRRQGDWYSIVIVDSVPGVSDDQLGHLFDYLYRAENSRNRETGGSGLGLAICQRIVEAHEGQIKVAQAHEGGLEVSLFIPVQN